MSKEETKVNENLVGSEEKVETQPSVAATPNGTIGTSEVAPKLQPEAVKTEKKKEQTVALFSDQNRFWDDYGRLEKGYSIVNKKVADVWLTLEGVRVATPEEIKAVLPEGVA